MSFATDNQGVAYAMIYIIMAIVVVGATWIMGGVIVDDFNTLAVDMTEQGVCGDNTTDALGKLNMLWDLILWLVVGCSFIYGLVTAIRKERGGTID